MQCMRCSLIIIIIIIINGDGDVGNSRQAFWSRCPHLGDFLEGQQLQRDRSTKSQQSLMVSTNSELSHKICYDLTNDPGRP